MNLLIFIGLVLLGPTFIFFFIATRNVSGKAVKYMATATVFAVLAAVFVVSGVKIRDDKEAKKYAGNYEIVSSDGKTVLDTFTAEKVYITEGSSNRRHYFPTEVKYLCNDGEEILAKDGAVRVNGSDVYTAASVRRCK